MSSFGDWLRRHRMAPLQKLFMLPITAMGYGTLDEIPTPHALRYINASIFWSLLKTGLHVPQGWPKRFVGGFGSMWQQVADQLDVEYETETVSVDRSDGVRIVTEHRGSAAAATSTGWFWRCHRATPSLPRRHRHRANPLLTGHDPLQPLRRGHRHRRELQLVGGQHPAASSPRQRQLATPRRHPVHLRQAVEKRRPHPLLRPPRRRGGSRRRARDRMEATLKLSSEGSPATRWRQWEDYADWPRYFPRVSIDDMASFGGGPGWYDQVEAIQGDNHTYLCHGVVSFELVERVMRYALAISSTIDSGEVPMSCGNCGAESGAGGRVLPAVRVEARQGCTAHAVGRRASATDAPLLRPGRLDRALDRVDPEDLQLAIARFQDMCGRLVHDVGGHAAKTMARTAASSTSATRSSTRTIPSGPSWPPSRSSRSCPA